MQHTHTAGPLSGAALGFILQPLLHCFGLPRPHGEPDYQEAILDAVPPLRSTEFSATRFLTATYVARTLRPLICLPGLPASSPYPSQGRHLAPLRDASPKLFNEAGGAYYLLVSPALDHTHPPLDLCGHCHTEKGCSLGSHSLSPCLCLNDHRFEQQRTYDCGVTWCHYPWTVNQSSRCQLMFSRNPILKRNCRNPAEKKY
ncbi:hypothetical protein B0H16DRAFT_1539170 [Mycena metata]|uniref:Uncharacterized protein n=1 Tax=Mycena metata TaxID=1033252 RepID=A0AAD7NEC1_9AGAR|nr:hypothetical protein B0H16DRAFT_1539170 [Mycena metata]